MHEGSVKRPPVKVPKRSGAQFCSRPIKAYTLDLIIIKGYKTNLSRRDTATRVKLHAGRGGLGEAHWDKFVL